MRSSVKLEEQMDGGANANDNEHQRIRNLLLPQYNYLI